MKRNLFTQIKNEWRENIWLVIELAVVCLAIWFIVTLVYLETKGLFIPRGFDPENVYTADTSWIGEDSPNRVESEDNGFVKDLNDITERLRKSPYVESVSVTNSLPYNYNYSGHTVTPLDNADSVTYPYMANLRCCTPEYIDVFRIRSLTGSTPEQLKEMLRKGEIFISDNDNYSNYSGKNLMDLKGKRVIIGGDSTRVYRVGDVIEKIRRNDYEDSPGGTALVCFDKHRIPWGNVIVRIKPGCDAGFREEFKNSPELRRQRNVYLTNLRPLADIREANQRSMDVKIRTEVIVMAFLMITVFLGLLGSFWFRMQQRVSEIAIRKVCGAKKSDIFRRVVAEGMILLAFAVTIVSACIWPFMGDLEGMIAEKWHVMLISEAVTVALVALGIILSLWYPARKAMNVEPAIAVKTE